MKIALLQMTSGTDRAANGSVICAAMEAAAANGAAMLFTPEMACLLDRDRSRAAVQLTQAAQAAQLATLQAAARKAGIWAQIGMPWCPDDRDGTGEDDAASGRLRNRSILIDNEGEVRAVYDKIHLFDVSLPSGEAWRESAAYAAGTAAQLADTPAGRLGLSICYDVRFSSLYAELRAGGAELISVPAAFTQSTGAAHWHVLLRARAIETQCWIVAPAQCGVHEDGRATYGHSLVVDPWGEVLLDMGTQPGLGYALIDASRTHDVRAAIPMAENARSIGAAQLAADER